ncbi:FtsX-like permease family protein [Sporichthya sp.]|uniref:ABC transporter permease n=1 Tax=Sporichthya sp. TaxID=65475 RepID=UPI001820C16D|nr:FtsX-like permease family protein [Sporichthya sp.]MBA3743545.1 FtsX-like permease family protein [Sporichthya sp.]
MWKASLRSVVAHRLRLMLSGLAVVLGVAFVAGSLIFTSTISTAFDKLFDEISSDVTVSRDTAFDANVPGQENGATTVPADLVPRIAEVPGVANAEGDITIEGVRVVGADGDVVGVGGAPGLGIDYPADGSDDTVKLLEGRVPSNGNEVVLDAVSAETGDLKVDDRVRLLTPGPEIEATIVGIFKFGDTGNLGGATLTGFTEERAHEILGSGDYTEIRVDAEPGANLDQLRDEIQQVIPNDYIARTKAEQADENSSDIKDALGFLNIFLLIFAFIAVFVGSFIILNTFTMLVAQRTRELALFRALGASRRQVTLSVMVEAAVVGFVGSTLGLLSGLGIASLLRWLFQKIGIELGDQGLVVKASTVLTAYAVGMIVTMIAAYFPARRAAKVPPVAAMTDEVAMPERSLRIRALIGSVLTVLGIVVLALGLAGAGSKPVILVGLGALAVLIGVTVVSPILSQPFVRAIGAPFPKMWGTVGRMSVANALRNPRRTAATSSALMIGLALIGTFGVLAASINASVGKVVDQSLKSDFILLDPSYTPFSPQIAERAKDTEGVKSVTEMRATAVQIKDNTKSISAITPESIDDSFTLDFKAGDAEGLRANGLLIDDNVAENNDWKVGDTVQTTWLDGSRIELRVGGIFEKNEMLGGYLVSLDTAADGGTRPVDILTFVNLEDGANAADVRQRLDEGLADNPAVELKNQDEYTDSVRAQVNQLLGLIYGMLALAVVIAVLGIVNTLALSVTERTREIGLLRAIGMSRRQLRRMIRLESVVMAIFGAVLGLIVGLGFGISLQRTLADDGISELRVPGVQLVVFLVVAALVGVLAAVWPARRAAKLDVLQAISTH